MFTFESSNEHILVILAAQGKSKELEEQLRIENKEAVNMIASNGLSLLGIACINNQIGSVQVLLRSGADIYFKATRGSYKNYSLIALAAMQGHVLIVAELIRYGASINDIVDYRNPDSNGTFFHETVEQGAIEGVQYLLSIPAMRKLVNEEDMNGYTAIILAALNGRNEIVEILSKAGASANDIVTYRFADNNGTLLHEASEGGFIQGVKYLLTIPEMKTQVNALALYALEPGRDIEMMHTPLMLAIKGDYQDIVKMLLQAGASIEVYHPEYSTEELLSSQGFLNLYQNRGVFGIITAAKELIQLARTGVAESSLKELLARGASVHQVGRDDNTPLHLAVFNKHLFLMEELLNEGANLQAVNSAGLTPLALASHSQVEHTSSCAASSNDLTIVRAGAGAGAGAGAPEAIYSNNTLIVSGKRKLEDSKCLKDSEEPSACPTLAEKVSSTNVEDNNNIGERQGAGQSHTPAVLFQYAASSKDEGTVTADLSNHASGITIQDTTNSSNISTRSKRKRLGRNA